MILEIASHLGVGPFRFGMTPMQIRSAAAMPCRTFKKTPASSFPMDVFDQLGVHVYYKSPGMCIAVEMGGNAKPIFRDRQLVGQPFSLLSEWLQSLDVSLEIDEVGLTSKLLGIGLYAPGHPDSKSAPIKGVIVFERNYYG